MNETEKEDQIITHVCEVTGEEYTTYEVALDDDSIAEYKLFHTITNGRLETENFAEYQNRKLYIKKFKKDSKKGRMIWFSKNPTTLQNLRLANMLVGLKAENGKDEEEIKESLLHSKHVEEVAYKTNLGTYNKKKVEAFIESHQAEEEEQIKLNKKNQ